MTFTLYHSWGTSRAIAIGIVAAIALILFLLSRFAQRRGAKYGGLLNGLDNRWSTSKVSIFLWTLAILWAFITLLLRFGGSAIPQSVPAAYFALLGIPSAGALGAKAITSQAGGKTTLDEPAGPVQGFAQIFCDDTGAVDLLDSQYFLFNCVLLAYFVATFWHIADPTPPSTDIALPALPGSLLALAGISTATYLGKKQLSGPTTSIPAGSSLQVTADSDVTLPGGGTITLASPGTVTIYPGVSFTSQTAASVTTAKGGRVLTASPGRLQLSSGARISGSTGAQLSVATGTTVLAPPDAKVQDAGGNAVQDLAAGPVALAAGATIVLGASELILTANGGELTVPTGVSVQYDQAGSVTVTGGSLAATVSAGATLGQTGTAAVSFPDGASYIEPSAPGPATSVDPGGSYQLSVETDGSSARTITLVRDASVALQSGTTISFPAAPTPVGADVTTTATTQTDVNLPNGGDVTIGSVATGAAARVPNGAVVEAATTAGSVTATSDGI